MKKRMSAKQFTHLTKLFDVKLSICMIIMISLLTFANQALAQTANAGSDQVRCSLNTATLAANASYANNKGKWTYVSGTTGTFAAGNDSLPNAVFTAGTTTPSGTTTLRWTIEPGLVISQVYAGGNQLLATFRNDFVELHNRSSQTINLAGYSLQTAVADGNLVSLVNLSGSVGPGKFFLISLSGGIAYGVALPTADFSSSNIDMNIIGGKLMLFKSTTLQSACGASVCSAAVKALKVDEFAWGTASGELEGSVAQAFTVTNSAKRKIAGLGCDDTNDNGSDFEVGTVNLTDIHNTASAAVVCPNSISDEMTLIWSTSPSIFTTIYENSGTANNGTIFCGDSVIITAVATTGSYLWTGGATTQSITVGPHFTTTYYCTITDGLCSVVTVARTITVSGVGASVGSNDISGSTSNDGFICQGDPAFLTANPAGASYLWSNGLTAQVIAVYPLATTTYYVTITTSPGCSGVSQKTINVSTQSTAIGVFETSAGVSNDGIICAGSSINLVAVNGSSFLWSNGSFGQTITVLPGISTSYSVTMSNQNGCTSTASRTIFVLPAPNAAITATESSGIPNDGKIILGSSVNLNGSGGNSYSWSPVGSLNQANLANVIASPTATTTYILTVTDLNQCTATSSTQVIVEHDAACTNLIIPIDNSTNVAINTTLSWNPVSSASGYRISLGTSPGAGQIINNLDLGNANSYSPTANFPYNTKIYVKIVPYNIFGNALACSEHSFTTIVGQPLCASIINPIPNSVNVPINSSISWTPSLNADGYKLYLGTSPGGNQLINGAELGNITTYYLSEDLPSNSSIFLKVVPYNFSGNAVACTEITFNTSSIASPCWKLVGAGEGHTAALKADGTLWAWGDNSAGQIGAGTASVKIVPTQIGNANDWKTLETGDNHSLAIKWDGSLWAWGANWSGQLGDGSFINKNIPTRIGLWNDWKMVSAGSDHTLAIKTDGSLWAWGLNGYGQLGDGTTLDSNIPIRIGTQNNWKSISAGADHSLAQQNDGSIWSWGNNSFGQLGDGSNINRKSPTKIGTLTNWKAVYCGYRFTLAIKLDGTIWSWGFDGYGQLGDGLNVNRNTPAQIGHASNWKSIYAGAYHALALKTDGGLWTWGKNSFGQMGDGTTTNKDLPTKIGNDTDWDLVFAGMQHSFAAKTNGHGSTWGWNGYNQLGDGTAINRNSPNAITSCDANIRISPVAFLQGAFNNLTLVMDDKTRTTQLFPLKEPFTQIGINMTSGINAVITDSTTVLANRGLNSIVDWVLVELRNKNDGSNVQYSRPFLLQSDGDIVGLDGISPVIFPGIPTDQYYFTLRHKNHLGFRTLNPISLSSSPTVLNFTTNSVPLLGLFPQTQVSSGLSAMVAGDANNDGSIDSIDQQIFETQNGLFNDYLLLADFNLDGSVDSIDSILWEMNNGKYEELY